MPTATSATAIETRAPTMIIERMSRPKWSVPNQCAADGGCSLRGDVERRDVVGRPDEATASAASSERPPASAAAERAASRISAPPEPRIDHRIGEVDQEGDEDHRGDQQHHHALDHDQVALADRLEHQPPEAGQEEHVLDDDGAGEQERELQPDDGQHRDQRVAQRVPPQRLAAASGPWRGRCGCSPRPACRSAPSA